MSELKSKKPNKPFYKKWWFILIVAFFVIGGLGNLFESDETKQKREDDIAAAELERETKKQKKEEENEKKKEEEKDEEQKTEEKEPDKKKEKKKEKKEKTSKSIDEKLQEDDENVDKAALKDGILILEKEPGGLWDENSLFHSVYDLFETMDEAFKDKSVDEVEVNIQTKMTDTKGNESLETVIEYLYTRESFEELNYENFTDMAFSEQWRILNESDLYIIHPGIYKNLKEKYTNNLISGNSKLPPIE